MFRSMRRLSKLWLNMALGGDWLNMALGGDPKKSTAVGEDGSKGESSAATMSAPTLTIKKELGGLKG